MNTKRQTIWLVSMLSLMVVLSAYYLFTDNVDEMDVVSDDQQIEGSLIDAVEVGEHSELPDFGELMAAEDGLAGGTDNGDAAGDQAMVHEDEQISESGGDLEADNPSEQEILQKVQAGAQSGEEYMAALEMKRTEALHKETTALMDIATNPKASADEAVKAEERLRVIEETQAKVDDLEEQLMQHYENVIITDEKGKWNIVVKADKLERSQVVTIIDMVMEQLQVGASKIAVEYVS